MFTRRIGLALVIQKQRGAVQAPGALGEDLRNMDDVYIRTSVYIYIYTHTHIHTSTYTGF